MTNAKTDIKAKKWEFTIRIRSTITSARVPTKILIVQIILRTSRLSCKHSTTRLLSQVSNQWLS